MLIHYYWLSSCHKFDIYTFKSSPFYWTSYKASVVSLEALVVLEYEYQMPVKEYIFHQWFHQSLFVIITQISKRKWRWIGHILRKPANNITRQALRWNPQGKRKRGRPRNSWRRGVESQMRNWGHTWATLGRFAQDRTRWRTEVVNGLCSNQS